MRKIFSDFPGQPDSIEIQGDPGKEDLLEVIKKEFKDVPYKKFEFVDTT